MVRAILIPFQVVWFVITNFKFVFIILLLWFAGYFTFNNYGVILSNVEYIQRCIVWEYWHTVFMDLLEMIKDIYNKAICWTNALGLMNRLLNVNLLIRTLRDCGKDPPFDFYTWLRIIGNIMVHLISDTLQWTFSKNVLDSAFPGFTLFEQISTELIPYTTNGLICLCKDTRIIFIWAERILNSVELDCIGHQLMNTAIGGFQTVANFVIDLLKLIFFVIFGSGTITDVRDTLLGIIPGDVVIPNLSRVNLHERVNSAAVYLGEYLNIVFMITYCTVTSEIDARGDVALSEPLYQTCATTPQNKPQLFCIIGIIVSGLDRFLRLQHTLLWHFPQILYETFTQPAGSRYIIDEWFERDWDIFFDTLRDPLPRRSYAVSLNFPPIIPGTNVSSILWPNNHLYGPPVKLDCHLLNNSRFQVPCEQCPTISEIDGETCACATAAYLDTLTEPIIDMTLWGPSVCCLIPRIVRAGVALGRFAIGTVIYVLNFDRLGTWLADQNHYDIFFTEVAGEPYVVGGVLVCIRNIVLGFDERMRCFVDLFVKPAKFLVECIRSLVIAVVRLINTILGTPEPGFEDYICITSSTNCIDLERMLSHLRRTRIPYGHDPTFSRVEVSVSQEPAFIDCVCYWLNFQVLIDFLDDPPQKLPNFCCVFDYGFRLLVELIKLGVEFILAFIETLITIFDSSRPFTIVIVEWAACISLPVCSNVGDMASDVEDFLNCPCELLFDVEDILGPPTKFYCICDILSAVVQVLINLLRSALALFSALWDLLYCIGNGWPLPHCGGVLYSRIDQGFDYFGTALDAASGAVGGIGCVLGLPWVGLTIDCLGTTYTWPLDHPACHTSQRSFGPGKTPCTMSDRLSQLFFYLFKIVTTILSFIIERFRIIIAIGFTITGGGTLETTISGAIKNFFLDLGEPLFGKSNLLITDDFNTPYNYPWPNTTGVNTTALYGLVVNTSGSALGNWTFQAPPSNVVYGKTFNYTIIAGLDETTGLIQAMGLCINCLLGLPTTPCEGPLLFQASRIDGRNTGCLGDLLIVAGNALRDVYTAIIDFLGNGLLVLETLFTNPSMLGNAIIAFIQSFFKIIFILVQNAQIIVDAIINVIVEVARFVLGSGVADMLAFFLNIISKVISVFIFAIQFLLSPFINKRYHVDLFVFQYDFETNNKYPSTLEEAYAQGFDTYFQENKNNTFFYNAASQEKWMNAEYWKSHLRNRTDTYIPGGKKRQSGSAQEEDMPNVLWSRVRMEDFGTEHIATMTDGTLCKKTMTILNDLDRFDGMDLAQEWLWRGCFIAYSLPNEIYGYTGGSVSLEPDTFYNPLTFLKSANDTITVWQEYTSFRSQNMGSTGAGGGSFTEVVPVPEEIMRFAEHQLAIQEMSAGMTAEEIDAHGVDGSGSIYVNTSHVLSSILDASPLSETIAKDVGSSQKKRKSEHSKKSDAHLPSAIPEKLRTLLKNKGYHYLFRNGPPSYFQNVDDMLNGKHECMVSNFKTKTSPQQSNLENHQDMQYCMNTGALYGGFTLYVKYPHVSESERDLYLKSLTFKTPSLAWDRKRGLIDISSGTSLDQTLVYNQYVYDKPNSPKYNPFLGTHLTIYTSLSGHMVLNISKVGYLIPVIDGKIALTHANMSFFEYLQRNQIDNDINLALISTYEHHELDQTKDSFLRLNAKNAYLNYLSTNNYTEIVKDPDVLNKDRLTGDHSTFYNLNDPAPQENARRWFFDGKGKSNPKKENNGPEEDLEKDKHEEGTGEGETWKSTKKKSSKESMTIISSWLRKLENIVTGKTHGVLEYLNKGPQLREHIGALLAHTVRGVKNNFYAFRKGYKNPSVTLEMHLPNYAMREKRDFAFPNVEHTAGFMDEYKKNSLDVYIAYRNAAYKEAKSDREKRNMNMILELFTEHLPGLFQHISKTVNAYMSHIPERGIAKHLSPNDTVWQYDHKTSSLKSVLAGEAFLWETSEHTDNVPKVVDSFFYAYGQVDEVHVLHSGHGKYSTYKTLSVRHLPTKDSLDDSEGQNPNNKRYWTDIRYSHPRDHILHRTPDSEILKRIQNNEITPSPHSEFNSMNDANTLPFAADINYYEYYYMSQHSAKKCLNDVMWPEYLKLSTAVEGAHERMSKDQYELALKESQLTGRPLDIVEVYKCYRKLGLSKDNPHQVKYGHILRGKSLYQHRFEMLGKVRDVVMKGVYDKLNFDTIKKNIKTVYLDPWIKKYRDTIEIDKRVPTITGPLVLYEKIRRQFFGLQDKSYAIPDIILVEMGHSVTFFEDVGHEKRSTNQEELYEEWYQDQMETWGWKTDMRHARSSHEAPKKRSHFPPLVDICLPRNSSDPSSLTSTCLNCRGCRDQHCSFCGNCYNCTPGLAGYDCLECGSCRVGPTSRCVGGCFQCTDCLTEATCLDCKIVQAFLTGAIDIVNFCVQTRIYNNTSIIIKPVYNDTSPYVKVVYNSSIPAPNYASYYGYTKLLQYLSDLVWYYVAKWSGIDIYGSAIAFLSNFLLDPFDDRMGIGYVLYYKLPIPLLSRCNRDIHLMCTFGTGLRNALILVSVMMLVIFIGLFFNLGIFGMLFSVSGLPHLFVVMVMTFAWHWNVACAGEPVWSLFNSFGLSILAMPMLPECMMDEVFDLLNGTISRCSSWLPPGLTTDNITCPDSCDVLVNITDCSQYGFYSLPTVIGYAGQRFIPDPLNFWFNDYLNRTCLVKGLCPYGLGWAEGILHPFFEVNFKQLITYNLTVTDPCFGATSFGILMLGVYISAFILLVYLIWTYFELVRLTLMKIISLPPLSWFIPKVLQQ